MLKIFLKTEIEKTPKLERLWITEYNPDILQKQLDNLENNDKYIDLGKSHICELLLDEYWYYISDKITGQTKQKINLKEVFVLKVISDKEDTIAIHNGNDYFKIYVEMNGYKGNWYRKPNIDRVFSLDGVAAITEKLKNTSLYIMSTDQKIKTKEHPFLYNLNDILREASTLKKIPITKCKIALNNLYTKGYITNPNTTSRHLPSNYANYLLKILKHIAVLSQYKKYIDYIKVYAEINITDRVLNNNYVDNTHAIIPTPSTPKCVDLDSTEYFLYDLIIKRFLACFMKPFRK
jgi:DNA topoisomerase-3